ncbi:GHKL domain-containing protein [Clostridium sp. P21]|uniref:GHKL domain-containing protein n=1 Tax=Clostridium muellerianum TaxID=2716538 RepID=A0A7Y0HMN3_9CLOT|nr:GHKL domain-containing protein [Clostridium muellerianum]NMM61772.1 GHKL domain-containing protein [Clostridium muellerianum]
MNFLDIVRNYYDSTNIIDISSILKKGFSTKGENRGYGLYNVKKIVKNSGGKLQLFFENDQIIFKILF